ncbi:hypothetical protein AAC387_Pa04g2968 [Persea americana]
MVILIKSFLSKKRVSSSRAIADGSLHHQWNSKNLHETNPNTRCHLAMEKAITVFLFLMAQETYPCYLGSSAFKMVNVRLLFAVAIQQNPFAFGGAPFYSLIISF